MIKHLENANEFEKEVQGDVVLVDFFAEWCGPCQMLAPLLEQLDVKVVKIDVDELPDLARQFRVMSIPTLMLFKDGKFVKKQLGYMPIEALREFVK
ncbi:MAG: thioredoxin [Bacilli bacterium]|nr:thioredoxin [Bacilli bacterium]